MAAQYGTCVNCGAAVRIPAKWGVCSTRCPGCRKWLVIKDGQVIGTKN
jgi:hypothetical protein